MDKIDIWVTKYALTSGVFVRLGRVKDGMAIVDWPGGLNGTTLFHGEDWHRNRDDAEARVRAMIETRRRSLMKAMRKLDALEESIEQGGVEALLESVSDPAVTEGAQARRREED